MGKRESPIKVCLTNQGNDTETPWADDLGDAPSPPNPPGSRLVRLVNVPFLHAKPTWGDVIIVEPDEDQFPIWDRRGVPFSKVDTRVHEDGGRWAMIVDYAPHPDSPDADRTYATLARACAEHEIVCEGAWGPRDGEPGRTYLAVKNELSDKQVMARLRAAELPCELIQVHPEPPKRAPKKKKAAAAKPKHAAAKRTPKAAKKAAKPAAKKKPVAKKR